MSQTYVITGGAGFIGSNLAAHFLSRDTTSRVIAFDNFRTQAETAEVP